MENRDDNCSDEKFRVFKNAGYLFSFIAKYWVYAIMLFLSFFNTFLIAYLLIDDVPQISILLIKLIYFSIKGYFFFFLVSLFCLCIYYILLNNKRIKIRREEHYAFINQIKEHLEKENDRTRTRKSTTTKSR